MSDSEAVLLLMALAVLLLGAGLFLAVR